MPIPRKPRDPKPAKQKPGVAAMIRQGKVELSDEELTKVAGGQRPRKDFTQIE